MFRDNFNNSDGALLCYVLAAMQKHPPMLCLHSPPELCLKGEGG